MTDDAAPRVLTIQSSVVSGHVGNTAAVFPLQLLGFDVLPLNTVQLATHTGYPNVAGKKLSGDEVRALVRGLTDNGLLTSIQGALSGFMLSADCLSAVTEVVAACRALSPSFFYLCDPVLGDREAPGCDGRLYVPAEMVTAMVAHIRASAPDVVTPNAFEAEVLTGCPPLETIDDALQAADALHALGARIVVITSSFIVSAPPPTHGEPAPMLLIVSAPWSDVLDEVAPAGVEDASGRFLFSAADAARTPHARFGIQIPRLAASFTGTGDLFAALILAHVGARRGSHLVSAIQVALATTHAVCARTFRKRAAVLARVDAVASSEGGGDEGAATTASSSSSARARVAAATELSLIPSRFDILTPPPTAAGLRAFALRHGER